MLYSCFVCETPSTQISRFCNIFVSIFAAVPCCKLESCCWDYWDDNHVKGDRISGYFLTPSGMEFYLEELYVLNTFLTRVLFRITKF